MHLGTIRHNGTTKVVRVERERGEAVLLDASDVGQLLSDGLLDTRGGHVPVDGLVEEVIDLDGVDWGPVIAEPNKIICVGLNYRDHVEEMGRELPDAPTYFSKFSGALIGANDLIHLPDPALSTHNDWEAELAIVIGATARNVSQADALEHIAGFTVFNDFSVRDYQRRTSQFLAGKTFEHASGLGPVMVTPDEIGDGSGLAISSRVNGEIKQQSNTDQLIFGPAELVSDLSQIITLVPGDVIATGTPGGVGAARTPPEWLVDGDELVVTIDGIGSLRHRCVVAN